MTNKKHASKVWLESENLREVLSDSFLKKASVGCVCSLHTVDTGTPSKSTSQDSVSAAQCCSSLLPKSQGVSLVASWQAIPVSNSDMIGHFQPLWLSSISPSPLQAVAEWDCCEEELNLCSCHFLTLTLSTLTTRLTPHLGHMGVEAPPCVQDIKFHCYWSYNVSRK